MGHDHSGHNHDPDHAHSAPTHARPLIAAILITLLFMAVEFAGGYVANSLALISDGAHMLTDIGAMGISLFAIWVSQRPSNATMSFGYQRAEILGAFVSGLIIWMISGTLIYEAILRLRNPPDVQGPVVFIVAVIGLIANLIGMKFLHSAKHDNLNLRAAYLHMLSDCLGSVGAIVAGAVLWLTHWSPIDPIVTIFFALLMLVSSWNLVKETVGILMESTPPALNSAAIKKDLESLPGVREVHDLHIWTVSSGRYALSVHLISEENPLNAANSVLKNHHGIIHTTIQVEHPKEFRSEGCYDCAPPAS